MSYLICLIGASGIMFGDPLNLPYLDLVCNFIVKFGIASAYQGVYLTSYLFPIVYNNSSFGICCM
jgi:hypothetical protein